MDTSNMLSASTLRPAWTGRSLYAFQHKHGRYPRFGFYVASQGFRKISDESEIFAEKRRGKRIKRGG
jgi:hypothetical protein